MKEKGKYVTRSVYQKLAEENKRLLQDIRVLTREERRIPSMEKILVIQKWRKKFREDRELMDMLREGVKRYLQEHPEYDITKKIGKP